VLRSVLLSTLFLVTLLAGFWPGPAIAADSGQIVGRVVDGNTQKPRAGVKVTLSRASTDGKETATSVLTDKRGRYSFDNLVTGTDYVYAIDAEFDGGLFAGSALQLPDDTEKKPVVRSTLRVWKTTTDPNVIQLARDDLFIGTRDAALGVIEAVTVANTSQQAYIGRGREKGGDRFTPSVAFSLPPTTVKDENGGPGVQLVLSDIDVPILLPSEFGVAANVAIPPGKHKLTFSYMVAGDSGSFDLTRNVLYPVIDFSVYATDPLDVRSNRLADNGDVSIGDKEYARYSSTEALDAGDPLQILAVAEAGTPGLLIGVPVVAGLIAAVLLLFRFVGRNKAPRVKQRAARRTAEVSVTEVPEAEGIAAPVLEEQDASPRPAREDVLVTIAKLDVDYEKGAVDEATWREQRARLKGELGDPEEPKVSG
jgi:hypothetical protein